MTLTWDNAERTLVLGYIDEDENTYLTIPLTEQTLNQMLGFIKLNQEYDSLEAEVQEQERRGEWLENYEPDAWLKYRKKTYGE